MSLARRLVALLLAPWLVACSGGDDGGGATTTQTAAATTTTAPTSTTANGSMSAGETTSGAPTTGETGETTSETTTGVDPTTTSTGECEPAFDPDPPGPGGAPCVNDNECPRGQLCFVMPLLGGVCGECLDDEDCPDGGCTLPHPLTFVGAYCNTGKPGAGCQTDAACHNVCHNHCGVAFDISPVLVVSTCGACETDAECAGDDVCAPFVDVPGFTGISECIPPGSLADGSSCSLADGGGAACASGICAPATIMGLTAIGICSECSGDAECPPGETCVDAWVDPMSAALNPAICQ